MRLIQLTRVLPERNDAFEVTGATEYPIAINPEDFSCATLDLTEVGGAIVSLKNGKEFQVKETVEEIIHFWGSPNESRHTKRVE